MNSGARFRLLPVSDRRLRAEGALDFAGAAAALRLGEAELKGAEPLAIDLAGLDTVDSAGLAVLIEWRSTAQARGLALRFEQPPQALLALARLSDAGPLLGIAG